MTTLQGYSPNSTNGSYGNLLFSANANYTGGASRFLLTNAFNATDFAIISSVDATTTPTLDSGGGVSSGTVAFSLKAGGNAAFAGNIGIGGATPAASGTGITFPATQSASSDANTLDDYEEVTWTPSVGGNATYVQQTGKYVKIGNTVNVVGTLRISTLGTGSASLVSGLPFTSAPAIQQTVNLNYYASSAVSTTWIAGYIQGSATVFNFSGNTTDTTTPNSSINFLGDSSDIYFSATYLV